MMMRALSHQVRNCRRGRSTSAGNKSLFCCRASKPNPEPFTEAFKGRGVFTGGTVRHSCRGPLVQACTVNIIGAGRALENIISYRSSTQSTWRLRRRSCQGVVRRVRWAERGGVGVEQDHPSCKTTSKVEGSGAAISLASHSCASFLAEHTHQLPSPLYFSYNLNILNRRETLV